MGSGHHGDGLGANDGRAFGGRVILTIPTGQQVGKEWFKDISDRRFVEIAIAVLGMLTLLAAIIYFIGGRFSQERSLLVARAAVSQTHEPSSLPQVIDGVGGLGRGRRSSWRRTQLRAGHTAAVTEGSDARSWPSAMAG